MFDVCHGCRQCLNLCNSFPNLFDLIDDTEGMEVDEVATEDYKKVVDDCYLCDMCYSTKCPYVPPNPLGIDFPHLMLRAKAIYLRRSSLPVSEKLLSSTDTIGKLAGIPVVTETINIVSQWDPVKQLNSSTLGIHENAWTPRLATKTFKQIREPSAEHDVVDGERTPGKVGGIRHLLHQLPRARHRYRSAQGTRTQSDPLGNRRKRGLLWYAQT